MHQTRNEYHQVKQGKKILKKVKGSWVTALAAGLLVSSLALNVEQVVSAQNTNQLITIEAMLKKESLEERLDSVYKEDHLFVVNTDDTVEDLLEAMKAYDFELDENIADDKELIDFLENLELEDFKKLNNLTEEEAEDLEVGQLLEVRLEVLKFAFDEDIQIDFTDERIKVEVDTDRMIEILTEQNSAAVVAPSTPVSNAVATHLEVSAPGEVEKPAQPQQPTKPEVPTESEVPKTPEVPGIPEVPEVPEIPEIPAVPETPEVPEAPESPETPEIPEAPEYNDEIAKEHSVGEASRTILSEEDIYDGKTGEEFTTVAGERYVASENTIEISRVVVEEEVGTETYSETYTIEEPEIIEVERDVEIGVNEEGEPIYEKQFFKEETGKMLITEGTREAEREIILAPAYTTVVSQSITLYGVPFNVITQYDNTLEKGIEELVQEGIEGQVSVTVNTTTINDVISETNGPQETILAPAQNKIIKVGTKEVVGSKKIILESQIITRGLIERKDPTLYEDEGKFIEGQDGFINKQIEVTTLGGSTTETILEEKTLEAIYDIQVIGTKPMITTQKIEIDRAIDFETEYKEYPGTDKTETILQKGIKGQATDTYLITYVKGVEESRELIATKNVSQPIKQIIQIGKITSDVYHKELFEEDEVIPAETRYYINPESTSTIPVIIEEGEDGLVRNLYEISYNNAGEEVGRELVGVETIHAVKYELIELSESLLKVETNTIEFNYLGHLIPPMVSGYHALEHSASDFYSSDLMKEVIEIIEDSSLPNGEIVLIEKGSVDSFEQKNMQYSYNGEIFRTEVISEREVSKPTKHIIKVGTNSDKTAADVVDKKSITWMDYNLETYEYDENGSPIYDENGNFIPKTMTIKIPDLNQYFKSNARKFSSIQFDQYQLAAMTQVIAGNDATYKLDDSFFYKDSLLNVEQGGPSRLKGEYYYSLFTKPTFYQNIFIIDNQKQRPEEILNNFSDFRFNEIDFEIELDAAPELIIGEGIKPHFDFENAKEILTKTDSKIENKQLIEVFTLQEDIIIYPGYQHVLNPTKFSEEVGNSEQGHQGLLSRTYEITKVDNVETSRKLIKYNLTPSKAGLFQQGIRDGLFRGGKG